MQDTIRKICTRLNDGQITVVEATDQLSDLLNSYKGVLHEIGGVKYVLFETEIPCTDKGRKIAKKVDENVKEYKGIELSSKHKSSFLSAGSVKVKVLIPEYNALEFSQAFLK